LVGVAKRTRFGLTTLYDQGDGGSWGHMKRVRSALEELLPPAEDAVLLVLSTESSGPLPAELVVNHPTLSSDYQHEECLYVFWHLSIIH
jgi:hypothetical protein